MHLISSENKKLVTKSAVVEESKLKSATKFGKDMIRFLAKHPDACGMSAVQVGYMKRLFVILFAGKKMIVINPEIISRSQAEESMEEGCLSYPGKHKVISRPISITVKYFNGKEVVEQVMTDFIARIFQHEYDHLEGIPCVV